MALKEMFPTLLRAASWSWACCQWLWARCRRPRPQAKAALYGAVVGVVIVSLYDWRFQGDLESQRVEIAVANSEVDTLVPVIKEVDDYKHKKRELDALLKFQDSGRHQTAAFLVLKAL